MKKGKLHQCNLKASKGIIMLFVLFLVAVNAISQNVNVSGAVSGNGTYPDLNSAFTAINGGTQTSANITIAIVASTNETVSALLNQGAWTSLTILPSGGSYTIGGNLGTPLIDLNGADNVNINGLNTGGNALTIVNTNTLNVTTATIRYGADATFNTLLNCTILGSGTSASLGTITFSTGVSTGNSNNIISNCNIGGAGINLPTNGIFSSGTASFENRNNTISNSNIYDYFSASLAPCGIFISANNTNWNISGNRLYQTTANVFTTANTVKAIQVNSGNSYTVSGNIIGYASAAGTGTTAMFGGIATRYVGIEMSVGTATLSTVQNNTIAAITLTTASSASTLNGALCGINILTGNVNVNNNLIGSTSGLNSISSFPSVTGGLLVGINSSSTGTVNITGNYIGACLSTGTTAAVAGNFTGINISGIATGMSVSSNTIGNTVTDNLRGGTNALTTAATIVHGINFVSAPSTTSLIVDANLIRNLASYGMATTGALRGIRAPVSSGYAITNNTITNCVTNNSNNSVTSGIVGTAGIQCDLGGSSYTVAGNLITNIANTGTATTHIVVAGIATGASTGTNTFRFNRIYNLINTSPGVTATTPPVACGFFIRSGSNVLLFHNNMVSLGNGQTSNTTFMGIYGNHGSTPNPTVQVYYNTFNIEGTVTTGALSTFGIGRTDFSATARTALYDIRNNLITNTRTGGTGGHYAIANNFGATASATGWGANASNYNILNANPATVGYWTSAQTFAGWKVVSASDANSFTGANVVYSNSANDLHINMGTTPNLIESNATPITGYSIDIDGQSRPGPVGSVNGGGTIPDIGADEFDGVKLDILPPTFVHTQLGGTCSTGDRTLSATIVDASGVPATGSLVPQIYYKKNAGAYIASSGVLASGTPSNGVWNFTINATSLGGLSLNDQVSYFLTAQDVASTVNVGALPSAGFLATGVLSITTTPTVPFSYLVSSLAGTYSVGAGGTYTSLTSAANVYNSSCLSGPVTYVLTDALYSTAETFPIVFNNNQTASTSNSLLITPNAGQAVVITPTLTSINSAIKFLDAKYISLNGINAGSSLIINNSNISSASANIWLASSNTIGGGCNNISIRNLTTVGGSTTTSYGIAMGVDGAAPGTVGGNDNDNVTIQGNTILKCLHGVLAVGNATVSAGGMDNLTIASNTIGPNTSSANNLGGNGIILGGAINTTITANVIQNIYTATSAIYGINMNLACVGFAINQNTINNLYSSTSSSGVNAVASMYLGSTVINGVISNNNIYTIANTNSSGYGAKGIIVNTGIGASSIGIRNNFISDVYSFVDASAIYWPMGIDLEGATGGIDIDFNSINLFGSRTGFSSGATGSAPIYQNSTGGNIRIRNNILSNTYDNSTSTTDANYAIYSTQAANLISVMDNNDYYVGGTGNVPTLAFQGSAITALAGIQTAFGGNVNSQNIAPIFTSSTDLHIVAASSGAMDDLGAVIAGITFDIDNQTRSTLTPDIGADEFTSPPCSTVSAGAISVTSYSACTGQSITLSTVGTSTVGSGIFKVWQVSSVPGGPYTNVTAGTGSNSINYNTGALSSTGLRYYRFNATCLSSSLTSASNEVTVSVAQTPTVGMSVNTNTICSGLNVLFTSSASAGSNYNWSGPANFTSNIANPTITGISLFAGGVYSLSASIANCTATPLTTSITVVENPTSLTLSINSASLCSGSSQSVSVSGGKVISSPVSAYSFTSGTGATLVNTASGSTVITSNNDDTPMATPAAIGFNFLYNGVLYNQFTASPDGWLMLGSTIGTSQFSNLVTSTTNIPKIYPYWDDLATGVDGFVRTLLTGTFPNRILTVEWFVTIPRNTTGNANSTFQILLYEANGLVEFRYGTMGSGAMSASSGLTGNATNFNSVTFTGPTTSSTTANDANAGQPASGTSYTFNPLRQLPFTWGPSAGLSSTSAATVTATPTISTVYSVNVSNSVCSVTNAVAIGVANIPSVNLVATNTLLCGGINATLTASGSNSYSWSTGATTSSIVISPSSLTTYSVIGTSTPCAGSANASISINADPIPTVNITGTTAICSGNTLNLNASGASTYSWNTGATTGSISASPAANTTYSVVGYSPAGCNAFASVSVIVNPNPTISVTGASSICATQILTLTVNGANTYSWNTGNTSTSVVVSPTTTTNYSVIGTSAAGCTATTSQSIQVAQNPTLTFAGSTGICTGQNASLTVSGANSYSWNTGATTNSIVTTPVSNTTYTVTGTDLLGCKTTSTQVVSVAASLTITISGPSSICVGQSANLTGNGGVTYTWNTGATSQTIAPSPTVTTTYSIVGASGTCSNTGVATISVNPNPIVAVSGSLSVCAGLTNVLTGSGANSYSWSTGALTSTAAVSPTTTTTYTLTGTNSFGCSNTVTTSILAQPLPSITVAQTANTICVNSPVTFTASGATTYTWNNTVNAATVALTPTANTTAIYTVAATSSVGCVNSRTVALATFSLPVLTIAPASATVCSLSQATFNASGATTYTWNGTVLTQTASFTPTTSSVYTLSGTNASGCVSTVTLGVTTNSLPVLSITPPTATVCASSTATFAASGANSYTWSGSILTSTAAFNPSVTTVYTITGQNAAGCRTTNSLTVNTNTLPAITIAPVSASVCAFSTGTYVPSGASTYTWLNTSTNTLNAVANSAVITPTVAAIYTVTGTNPAGCISSRTLAVGVYTLPTLVINPASPTVCSLSQVNYTASGAATYTWNGSVTGSTVAFTPTVNSTYTLVGADINNCVSTTTVAVATNTLPVVSINASTVTACVATPVTYTANGANTYTWSNSAIGNTVTMYPNANSVYTVIGTSPAGCNSSATVAVSTNSLPIVSINPSVVTVCSLSNVTLTASGADTYSWGTTSTNTTVVVTPSAPTIYSVAGTNSLGCVGIANAVVLTNTLPVIGVSASSATACANSAVTFTANGGTTYTWNTGANGASISVTPSITTTYTVLGTDPGNGCVGSNTISISTFSLPIINVAASAASVCPGASASFTASGAQSYSWTTGFSVPSITVTPSSSTVYMVVGTDAIGCSSTKTVGLGLFNLPDISVSPANQTICVNEVASFTANGATSYTWMPGNSTANTFTASPNTITFYTVTGTDANACTSYTTFLINVQKCTGLLQVNSHSGLIQLFPNPSNGKVNASFDFEGIKEITVVNAIGEFILGIKSENKQESFDLSNYAKGMYYVSIKAGGNTNNYRVIIE